MDHDELLKSTFNGNESDKDDALDEDWTPRGCEEVNEWRQEKGNKTTENLLTEFYEHLVDINGGYQSERIAQQYNSQVQSVIRSC